MLPTNSVNPFSNPYAGYPVLPAPVQQTTQYDPTAIPDLTGNHTYQALSALPPSAFGGVSFQQAMQQASAESQHPNGGLGGAIGNGIEGALLGAGIGSVVPVIGTGVGALVGGLGGALLGAFTPNGLQAPQNAVVAAIGDLENNQAGNILPDIKNQLFNQNEVAPPNYSKVFNPLLNDLGLPNQSLLGNNNIPILSGLTNPFQLGNIGLNIVTNPLSFIPSGVGAEGAKLATNEAEAIGRDVLNPIVGEEAPMLNKAGIALRNNEAQKLGFQNYADMLQNGAPDVQNSFLQNFANAARPQLSSLIKTPPAMLQPPMIRAVNDFLANNPITQGVQTLFGKSPYEIQMENALGKQTTQDVVDTIRSEQSQMAEDIANNENAFHDIANTYSLPDIQEALNVKETGAAPANEAQAALVEKLNQIPQNIYDLLAAEGMQPEDEKLFGSQYFPKSTTPPQVQQANAASQWMVDHGMADVLNQKPAIGGFLPSQTANAAKDVTIGKFVGDKGTQLYGNPGVLGLQKIDTYKYINPSTGEAFSQAYLPLKEALENVPEANYEANPLVSALKSYKDARTKVAYSRVINRLSQLKDSAGNPILKETMMSHGIPDLGNFMQMPLEDALRQGLASTELGVAGSDALDKAVEQIGKGRLKGKTVPIPLMNYLVDTFGRKAQEAPNAILQAPRAIGNLGRQLQILSPMYHQAHNLYPNQLLAGVSPLKALGNILALPKDLKAMRESQVYKDFIQDGGKPNAFESFLKQGGKSPTDVLRETAPGQKNRNLITGYAKFNQQTVEAADLKSRLSLYQKYKDMGYSGSEAVRKTEDVMFANRGRSPFEKNVLENVMPFYGWVKNNTMLWGKHPRGLAVGNGLLNAVNESTVGHQMALNPAGFQNKIALPSDIANINLPVVGKQQYLNPMLPFKDIGEFTSNPLTFAEGRVNMLASRAAQLASNTDYFGNPIYNKNLPLSMQSPKVFGIPIQPQLLYALTGSTKAPVMGAPTPMQLLSSVLGTPVSQTAPNETQLQQYYAQKNMMDAVAKQQLKNGAITYQQATPYNTSPGTQNHINNLQSKVYGLQDQLYGYHYENGQKVSGPMAVKHMQYTARNHALAMGRHIRSEMKYTKSQGERLASSLKSSSHRMGGPLPVDSARHSVSMRPGNSHPARLKAPKVHLKVPHHTVTAHHKRK